MKNNYILSFYGNDTFYTEVRFEGNWHQVLEKCKAVIENLSNITIETIIKVSVEIL